METDQNGDYCIIPARSSAKVQRVHSIRAARLSTGFVERYE